MAKSSSIEMNVCSESDPSDVSPQCETVSVPQGSRACFTRQAGYPVPYYKQASVCPEDNREVVVVERTTQIISNKNPFCVPACGQRAYVSVEGVTAVVNGSWLWNAEVGYLRIADFDVDRQQLTLESICSDVCEGQAAPGSTVPACSVFLAAPPLCSALLSDTFNSVFLNSGFIAPADGDCVQIAVTSVEGLYSSKLIVIQHGTYRVASVDSDSLITICNDGDGITPGTVIEYRDSSGNLTSPLVSIDSNPCIQPTTTHGKLIVCDNNIQKPFVGTLTGQVPVYDASSGEWGPATPAVPTLLCTDLTVGLTLDPINNPSFSYLVQVNNTTGFTAGDAITIGSTIFIIDTIDGLTTLHATPTVDPGVITNFSVGASFCQADCCIVLDTRMDVLEAEVAAQALQALQVWTPTVDINGTGTLSVLTISQTDFSRLGPWIFFKLSIGFVISGAGVGSGSTAITVSAPTLNGRDENVAVYPAHGDEAGAIVANGLIWRHVAATNELQFFKPGIAEFLNGQARIDLDGKYAVAP